jgi:GxxExxY protein
VDLNRITSDVIGCAIKVHRRLGPGLLESAYQICLEYELQKLGYQVDREKPVPLIYDDVKLDCGFRADLMVQGLVLVECKAKESLHPVDKAQLLSHLRLLNLQVGLLINFHEVVVKDGIHRIVNNYRPAPETPESP